MVTPICTDSTRALHSKHGPDSPEHNEVDSAVL